MTEDIKLWLKKAESNVKMAMVAERELEWDHVCFECQQAAEKFLKALLYFRSEELFRSHNLVEIFK